MTDIALDFKEETASVNRLGESLKKLAAAADLANASSLEKLRGAIQALGLSSKEQLQAIAAGTASILDKIKADARSNQVGQIFNPTAIKYNLDAVNQLVRSSAERMTTTLATEAGRQAEARAIASKEEAAKELAAEESKRDGIIREMVRARAAGEAINAEALRGLEAHYAKTKALAVLDANARFQAMTASAQKLREAHVEQLLASGAKPTAVVNKYGSDPVLTALKAEAMEKTAVIEAAAQKQQVLQEKLAAEANARLTAQNLKLHEALALSDSAGNATRLERMAQVYVASARLMEQGGANELRIKKLYGEAVAAEDLRQTAGRLSKRAGGMRENLADVAIAREQEREAALYRAYSVKLAAAVEESNRLVKSTKLEGLFSLHHAVETALTTGASAELAIRAQHGSAVVDAIQKNSSREIRAIITAREAAAVAAKSGATSIATLGLSSTGSLVATGTRGIDHSKAKEDTDKLGDSTKALTGHTHLLNDGFRGLVQSLGMYSASMTAIIPMMVGMAAGMAAIKPLKVGAEFEDSLFVIHELAGTTTADMVKVKAAILEMGASTQYGPLEVAKGLEILTLAGLSTVDALQAIKPVLNFASTGGVSLELAAETLVAVGTAYKYSAENFAVVGDVIAKTAADTMASVTDMSAAFKISTVVAQQYGASLQDTALAFGMLAQVGIRGTSAGTAYRNMLTEFNKGSGKAAEGIRLLGVDLKNADGSAKDLMTTMESLSKGLITKNSVSQGRLLDDIGNERGGKGIASFQAAFTAELNKSNPLLQREVDLLIQSGKASEAKKLAEDAVAATYAKMRDVAAKSAESTGGYSFLANLEKQFTTLGTYKGLLASLQTDFVKAFDTASDSTKLLAMSLRETLNTPEFTAGIAAITNAALSAADAFAKIAAFTFDEPIAAVAGLTAAFLTAQVAIAALPMLLTAAATAVTSVGYSLGMTAALIAGAFEISAGAAILAVGAVALAIAAVVTGIGYLIYSVMDSQTEVEKAEAAKREEFIKTATTQTELQEKTINAQQGQLDAEVARIGVLNDIWIKNRKLTELANAYEWQSITVTGGKTSEAGKALHAAAETLRAQRMTGAEAEAKAAGEAMQARITQWLELKLQIIDATRVQREHNLEAAGGMMLGSYSDNLVKIHAKAAEDTKAATTFADNAKSRAAAAAALLAERTNLRGYQAALDAAESKFKVSGTGVGGYTGNKFTRSPRVEQVKLETTNILEEMAKRDKLVLDADKATAANSKAILDAQLSANMISKSRYAAEVQILEERTATNTVADLNKQQAARLEAYKLANKNVLDSQAEFNTRNAGNTKAIGDNSKEIAKVLLNGANVYLTQTQKSVADIKAVEDKAYTDSKLAEYKHQTELFKIRKDTADWKVSEAALKAKSARARVNEEAIRNASPLQAAVLTAENTERERLIANAEKYDIRIQELTKSTAKYTEDRERGLTLGDAEDKANRKELETLDELKKAKEELEGVISIEVQIKGKDTADAFIRNEVTRIRDALTDAIMNAGKDGGKGLRDIIEAELVTKPFKILVNAVLNPITEGIAQGIMGQAAGGASGFASVLQGASLAASTFGSTVAATAAEVAVGGTTISGAMTASSFAIQGGSYAAGAGSAVGSLIPPLVIAAAVAKTIDIIGGIGSSEFKGAALEGGKGADGFSWGLRKTYEQRTGGLGIFSGETHTNAEHLAADPAIAKYMTAVGETVVANVKTWASAIGLSVDVIDDYTKQIDVALTEGMSSDELKAAIGKAFGGFADTMVADVFRDQLLPLSQDGETLGQTLMRLGIDLATVNNVLRDFNLPLFDVSLSGVQAAEALLQTVGGLDKFTALASNLETVNDVMLKLGQGTFDLSMDGAEAADKLAKSVGGTAKLSTMADELIHVNENLEKLGKPLLDVSVASGQLAHGMVNATDLLVKAQEKAERLQASYASFTANLSSTDTSSVASLQAVFAQAMAAATASIPSLTGKPLSSVTYDQYAGYTDPQRAKLDAASSAFKNLQDAIASVAKTAQDAAKTAQDAADAAAQAYTDALKSVEDSTRDVNRQLRDFGKTDFQKKLSQIAYAGQDKQAEIDKLSAKAAELSATASAASLAATSATLGTVSTLSNDLISASVTLSEDSQTVADNIQDTLANSTAALGDALTLVPAIASLFDGILAGLLKIPPALLLVKDAVTGVGGAASGAAGAVSSFAAATGASGQAAGNAAGPITSAGAAFDAVAPSASSAGAALTALGAAFAAAGAALSSLTSTFGAAAGALDGLNAAFASAASGLSGLGSAFESTASAGASLAGSLGGVSGALSAISGAAAGAAGRISAAASTLSAAAPSTPTSQLPSTPSTAPLMIADGGYIRGAGTTTSDSIPAMLSDKEFVVRASSVAKYGTGFLDALNAGTLPKTVYREGGNPSSGAVTILNDAQKQVVYLDTFSTFLTQFGGVLQTLDVTGKELTKAVVKLPESYTDALGTLKGVKGGKDFTGMDSASVSKFFRDLMANNAPTYNDETKTWSLSPEAQAALAPFANAGTSIDALLSGLKEREGWQDRLDVLNGKTTERELALKKDLASTTDTTTQALIRQVYAQEDLNKAREEEAKALDSVKESLKNFQKESSSLAADLASAFGTPGADSSAKSIRKDLALEDVRKTVTDADALKASPAYAAMSAADKLKTNATIQGIRDTATLAEKQYDLNEARKAEITLLGDAKSRLKSYTDTGASKEIERMRLQGNDAGANAAQKAIDLADVFKSTADATELLKTEGLTGLDIAALNLTISTNKATEAQYEKNAALDKEIEILNRYKSVQEDAAATNIELMKAMGNTAGAAALELVNATKGFTDAQIATVRQTNATKGLIAAYGNLSSTADMVTNSRIGLLTAQGDTTGAAALQRTLDIKPYVTAIAEATATLGTATTQAEKDILNQTIATNTQAIANVDLSKSLDKEAQAANDAKTAADALASSYADLKKQIENANIELLRASGRTQEADEAAMALALRDHAGDAYYESLYRELLTIQKLTDARGQLNTLEDSAVQKQIELIRANGGNILANALERSAFLANATAPAAAAQSELDRSNVSWAEFLAEKGVAIGTANAGVAAGMAANLASGTMNASAFQSLTALDASGAGGSNLPEDIRKLLYEFGQNQRTDSQQETLQSVVDTAQGIAAAYDLNKSLEGQLKIIELQDEAYKQNLDAQKNLAEAQKSYADVLKSTISTMKDFIDTLDGGASPLQNLTQARTDFMAVANKAASGDTSAYKDLTPAARAFLDLSKNYSKSIVDYQRDEAKVRTTLSSVIRVNQSELDKLPAELSKAADPTKDAWLKLQEATLHETNTSIILTALGVDSAASKRRLRTAEESLADRYVEAVYMLEEATRQPLLETFNEALTTLVDTTVMPDYTAFDLGELWGTMIAGVLPPYQMTNDDWNALIAGNFEGLVPSDFLTALTPDDLTNLIRGVMPEQLTVDSLISTTADVSDIVSTQISTILPTNFAGEEFDAQAMMQTAINNAMSTLGAGTRTPNVSPDLSTTHTNDVTAQGLGGGTTGTGSSNDIYYPGATTWAKWIDDLVRSKRSAGKHFADVVNALPGMGLIGPGLMFETVPDASNFLLQKAKVIPFAVGTNYVPRDMLAQIHEGEAIIPAAFNPAKYNKDSGNDALVAEIKALREELGRMREEQRAGQNAIAANTGKTARVLSKFDIDGLPDTRT